MKNCTKKHLACAATCVVLYILLKCFLSIDKVSLSLEFVQTLVVKSLVYIPMVLLVFSIIMWNCLEYLISLLLLAIIMHWLRLLISLLLVAIIMYCFEI